MHPFGTPGKLFCLPPPPRFFPGPPGVGSRGTEEPHLPDLQGLSNQGRGIGRVHGVAVECAPEQEVIYYTYLSLCCVPLSNPWNCLFFGPGFLCTPTYISRVFTFFVVFALMKCRRVHKDIFALDIRAKNLSKNEKPIRKSDACQLQSDILCKNVVVLLHAECSTKFLMFQDLTSRGTGMDSMEQQLFFFFFA